MLRPLLIYVPAVLLLIAALMFPPMGRDLVGNSNAREFALFLALWWMILATIWRAATWLVKRFLNRKDTAPGFDVISKD
jgi:hypothetical protein